MYIIPRLTPETLPDAATAAAWRADGVTLVHLLLDPAALDGADGCLDLLRQAGFAVQLELASPDRAEEAAERLGGRIERLFVPFDIFAKPRRLLALLAQFGSLIGMHIAAEEGAVPLPLPIEPNAMPPVDAVKTMETAGVMSILYSDPAAELLPLDQLADVAMQSDVNLFAQGRLETLDDLFTLQQMKLMGWLCPPARVAEAAAALRAGKERGQA